MLTHGQIWAAIDALAARRGVSASGLALLAGLDATSFNKSKRLSSDSPPRPRWPSTESLAKVLQATGADFADFAELVQGRERGSSAASARRPGVPLIGLAQAGHGGFFDDAGLPTGEGWEEVEGPGTELGDYALEITGHSMLPAYRAGDRIVVRPLTGAPRRGDRVVVRTSAGEVMAKEVMRITARKIVLASLNPDYPTRELDRRDIAWVARILWASQ
ncbi:helix-turn-helix transcriptional regulator [soil metagenome]